LKTNWVLMRGFRVSHLALLLINHISVSLSMSSKISGSSLKIDSHLHVWSNKKESLMFPYAEKQDPPDSLVDRASTTSLLKEMEVAGVHGALIVQPINHKFDHSYVASAIARHPLKFKGMLLHDPSLDKELAVSRLEDLALKGFVGVRFNPYLWPAGMMMSKDEAGLAVYKRAGELRMPVGVMCFKGLELHYEDIVQLVEQCPETNLILDHFAFASLSKKGDKEFEKLLTLSKYPSIVVKISALFRIAEDDIFPYESVRANRFIPLLKNFGAERLMFGTDFPFVLEQEGTYKGAVDVVNSWMTDTDEKMLVMGGTAQRLFGFWGSRHGENNK